MTDNNTKFSFEDAKALLLEIERKYEMMMLEITRNVGTLKYFSTVVDNDVSNQRFHAFSTTIQKIIEIKRNGDLQPDTILEKFAAIKKDIFGQDPSMILKTIKHLRKNYCDTSKLKMRRTCVNLYNGVHNYSVKSIPILDLTTDSISQAISNLLQNYQMTINELSMENEPYKIVIHHDVAPTWSYEIWKTKNENVITLKEFTNL